MVRISEEPIVLPNEFQTVMGKNSNALMILASSTKTIRIIPTVSPEVVKVGIEIQQLTPDYLKQMSEAFVKHNLKVVYSTGFCYKGDKCIYEAYFDPAEIKMGDNELKGVISALKGTKKIDLKRISTKSSK
jgi:hypothetical protein